MLPHRISLLLAGLLFGLAPLGTVAAQEVPSAPALLATPPGPISRFPTRFTVTDAPALFDQVLMVVDFPAGAWTPLRTPGGNVYTTVIDGEISIRPGWSAFGPNTHQAGETFVEIPGAYLEIGNSGNTTARVIATALLPKGAPLAIGQQAGVSAYQYAAFGEGYYVQDSSVPTPGPTVVHRASIEVERPASAFELVHLLVEFEPGIWTARHLFGGQELALVATGEVTLDRLGEVQVFSAGKSWVNSPGAIHAAGNEGGSFAQVAATYLLPVGAALTTVPATPINAQGRDRWYLDTTAPAVVADQPKDRWYLDAPSQGPSTDAVYLAGRPS